MHTFPKGSFRLNKRFQPIEVIGSGAYGMVCSATDHVSRKKVAIKKIASAFTMVQVAKRTLREIKLLKHFHAHKNIISILTIQRPPLAASEFKDLYVVMELQECDLHRIIHSQQALSEEHSRYFLYQLLCGLKYIHSANVLHRDIKPGNLLINSDCSLRIADFGMARHMATSREDHSNFMTEYVATRWYRAPEVLLSFETYTQAIDVWSVGCILAEMLGRRYLFPGRDYLHQLSLILSLLGTPADSVVQQVGSELARKALENFKDIPALGLHDVFPDASSEALALLSGLITFDPLQRITVEQALESPYLRKYRQPSQELICPPFSFDFENASMSLEGMQQRVHAEAMEYHTPGSTAYLHAQMALPKVTVKKRTSASAKRTAAARATTTTATATTTMPATITAAASDTAIKPSTTTSSAVAKGDKPAKKRKPRPLNKTIHPDLKPDEAAKLQAFRNQFKSGGGSKPPPQPAHASMTITATTTSVDDSSRTLDVDPTLPIPDGMLQLSTADLQDMTATLDAPGSLNDLSASLVNWQSNSLASTVDLQELEKELELGSPMVFKNGL
eukprot:TRINITY_DN4512_c0_g1_i1.p1 TRINITY_DN4512_c0_g1~~TRINITY_DN4512_c0_g1_i1.p1  ORF type:complete len:577 (+),score=117.89 TRINITY_DN4512_c0_g1_i1:44-1732(+)